MTAKEMFEKLGYKYFKYDDFIQFEKDNGDWISFDLDDKSYCHEDRQGITLKEHIAIHQQMKELGWL